MSQATIAYPGTFDPLTLGHEAIVRRATGIFGKVVVAVAAGHHKQVLFSLDERLEIARAALARFGDSVTVMPVTGLLARFLAEQDIKVVLRGMRTVSDYEYETQLADINRRQGKDVETLFMAPGHDLIHVYSHVVRELAMLGGDVSQYVSEPVARRLAAKFAARDRDG